MIVFMRILILAAAALALTGGTSRAQTMEFALSGEDRVAGDAHGTEGASLDIDWDAELKLGLLIGEPIVSLRFRYDVVAGRVTIPTLTEKGRGYETMMYRQLSPELQEGVRLTDVKLRMTFGSDAGEIDLVADVGATGQPGAWSFNIPGSPDWDDLFEGKGVNGGMLDAETAKAAWAGGLTLRTVVIEDADLNFHLMHETYMPDYDREEYRALKSAYDRLADGLKRSYGIEIGAERGAWTNAYFVSERSGEIGTRQEWSKRRRDLGRHLDKLSRLPDNLKAGANHGPYEQAVKDAEKLRDSIARNLASFDAEGVDPTTLEQGYEPEFGGDFRAPKVVVKWKDRYDLDQYITVNEDGSLGGKAGLEDISDYDFNFVYQSVSTGELAFTNGSRNSAVCAYQSGKPVYMGYERLSDLQGEDNSPSLAAPCPNANISNILAPVLEGKEASTTPVVYNPATREYAVTTRGQVSSGDYVYFLYDSFALYSIDKSGGGEVYRDLYFLDESLNVTDTRSCGARPTEQWYPMPDC